MPKEKGNQRKDHRARRTIWDIFLFRRMEGERLADSLGMVAKDLDDLIKLVGPSKRPESKPKRNNDDDRDGGAGGLTFFRRRRA